MEDEYLLDYGGGEGRRDDEQEVEELGYEDVEAESMADDNCGVPED